MLSLLTRLPHFVVGPTLAFIYDSDGGRPYLPNRAESFATTVISLSSAVVAIARMVGPMWLFRALYRTMQERSLLETLLSLEFWQPYLYLLSATLLVSTSGYLLRGIGRCFNADYRVFHSVYAQHPPNVPLLRSYDYSFEHIPVDHAMPPPTTASKKNRDLAAPNAPVPSLLGLPLQYVRYQIAHTFARRAMYPGSTAPLNMMLGAQLLKGRQTLMEEMRGRRIKVATEDPSVQLDGVFFDRRKEALAGGTHGAGGTLVLAFEGNASFYEMGFAQTVIQLGYSVLSFNRPGFGCSTGLPFPYQEQISAEAMLDFALNSLNFTPEQVILYAWSIGGYMASHLASQQPMLKGVVMDATFDTVEPLAVNQMPPVLEFITRDTIREHLNLNNAEKLARFNGPVLIYRRMKDEMMSVRRALPTNRSNFLARHFLFSRYGTALIDSDTVDLYLDNEQSQASLIAQAEYSIDVKLFDSLIAQSLVAPESSDERVHPLSTDQRRALTVYLLQRHVIDVPTTHCVPLPLQLWREPWLIEMNS